MAAAPASSATGAWRCALWCVLYAALLVYSSVVVGPLGFHYVPKDPAAAWQALLDVPLLDNGSDQRPDWIANLLLTVPLGFLATGALAGGRRPGLRALGALAAIVLGLAFVLAVKYAQLFFPPRTVSLNYIIAQSIGVCLGALLFHPVQRWSHGLSGAADERARLRLLLDVAVIAAIAFALFPFDIVLSAGDVAQKLARLPHGLLRPPGEGRAPAIRFALLLAGAVAMVPLGMRLALRRDHPTLQRIAVAGAVWMLVLLCASGLMLSVNPSLATLVFRIGGIVAGAALLRWLARCDLERWRVVLAKLVPLFVLPYLLLLAYGQGLFAAPHWQAPGEALDGLYGRGLMPLYYYYIVSKAHAAQNIMAHAIMYAPIGLMVWLRGGGGLLATVSAAVVALVVEAARALQPDLQPDVNAVLVAAVAAGLAAHFAPAGWRMLLSLTPGSRAAAPVSATRASAPPRARGASAVDELAAWQQAQFEKIMQSRGVEVPAVASAAPVVSVPAPAPTPVSARAVAAENAQVPLALRGLVSAVCLAGCLALAWSYPLGAAVATAAAAVWILLLAWQPSLWLLLLPAAIPTLDLAPWTGWLVTSEADIAVLATLAVLLLRTPLAWRDLWPRRPAGTVLLIAAVVCLIGLLRGLFGPAADLTDNPYLLPLNALRLAKGFIEALVLLPLLLARQRLHGDTVLRFGAGMLLALAIVAVVAGAERAAFVGLFDMHSDYRVVATFSSMHIGGGHIGAFVALALPFVLVCLYRPRAWTLLAAALVLAAGGYVLVVTFARTAYVAAAAALLVAIIGWAMARRRAGERSGAIWATVLVVLLLVIVGAGMSTPYMSTRFGHVADDLTTREGNWATGFSLEGDDPFAWLVGMGGGTYPRLAARAAPSDAQPGNWQVQHDTTGSFLTLRPGREFYFDQKVPRPAGDSYRLTLELRGGTLNVGVCAKLLLYSADCHGATLVSGAMGGWTPASAELPVPAAGGELPAPIDLSLDVRGATPVDIRAIRLTGPDGVDLLANGDFSDGTARWYFTSDWHLAWRIKNLYLATWFDGGLLGLLALFLLVGMAFIGAARALIRGDALGAPVLGGLTALLLSGVFDDVLEAPRLALLYYLVIMLGLALDRRVPAGAWAARAAVPTRPRVSSGSVSAGRSSR